MAENRTEEQALKSTYRNVVAAYEANDDVEALKQLDVLKAIAPPDTFYIHHFYYFALNIIAFRGKDYTRALPLAEQATRDHPDYPETWFLKGRILAELGRPVPASRAFTRALRLKPGDAASAYELAKILYRADRIAMAHKIAKVAIDLGMTEPFLREIVAADPCARRRNALYSEISRRYGAGDDDKTLELLGDYRPLALGDATHRWRYLYFIINILAFRRKDYAAALPFAEEATEAFPLSRETWFLKGRILAELGRPVPASRAFTRALRLKPDDAASAYELAKILYHSARVAMAKKLAALAIGLGRTEPALSSILAVDGESKRREKLYSTILKCYDENENERALELLSEYAPIAIGKPSSRERYFRLKAMIVGLRQNDLNSALAICREATQELPDATRLWLLTANLLVRMGRDIDAMRPFKRAMRLDPHNAEAAYEIAKILHRRNRRRMTLTMIARVRELGMASPQLQTMAATNQFYLGQHETCLSTLGALKTEEGPAANTTRLESLCNLAIRNEIFLAQNADLARARHITIGGVQYIGSTLLGALLGSTPGAAHAGETEELVRRSGQVGDLGFEIDFSHHPENSYSHCRVCGPRCAVIDREFREALACDPVAYYPKIAQRLGVSTLVTGDKGVMHKEERDPLFQFDLLILYKSPVPWVRSFARQQQTQVNEGLLRPDEVGDVEEWLKDWNNTYEDLLDLPIPESRRVVLNWEQFVGAPYAHFERLLRLLRLEGDPSVFETIRFGHFIGGNGQGSFSEVFRSGRVTFKTSDAKPLSADEEATVRANPRAQALERRLDRAYQRAFGNVAENEQSFSRRWSPRRVDPHGRRRPLDPESAQIVLRTPLPLDGRFHADGGVGHYARLKWPPYHLDAAELSDAPNHSRRSPLVLLEDGRALGPAHSDHPSIRAKGQGRFSHLGDALYFSTSDNSDPNTNGRAYELGIMPGYVEEVVFEPSTIVAPMEVSEAKQSLDRPLDLIAPFQSDGGHGFMARLRWLPQHEFLEGVSNNDSDTQRSPLVLLEDGSPIGPAHARHVAIRAEGGGRFSHWKDVLYFSASDNTDPNANGRAYSIVIPADSNPPFLLEPESSAVDDRAVCQLEGG